MSEITRIFVSHSHSDNAWCRAFVTALRARGADVWYDEQNLGFGTLRSKIEREMQLRPVFVAVFSPSSIVSKWVGREMDAAIYLQDKQSERVILPVVAAKCDIPPLWVSFKRISGPDDGALTPEDAAGEVVHALNIATPIPTPSVVPDAEPSESTTVAGDGAKSLPSTAIFEHAITDLYDRERGVPLVRYPLWLLIALAVTGFAALLVTGLYGYRDGLEGSVTAAIFRQAWPLYLWLCALLVALEWSVLRHPTLRSARTAVLLVTMLSILLTGPIYYYNLEFAQLLRLNSVNVGASPWTYTLINFGLLALYFGYQIRLWVRRLRGLPLRAPTDDANTVVTENSGPQGSQEDPSLRELIPGSLLGGGIVSIALAVVMRPDVINFIAQIGTTGVYVNAYTLALPVAQSAPSGTGLGPPSLSFIDILLALVLLPIALQIAAMSLTLRGIGTAVGKGRDSNRSIGRVLYQVAVSFKTFFDVRVLAYNVGRLVRHVQWPVLIVLAEIALASVARTTQEHLHLLSDQVTCTNAATCGGAAFYSAMTYEIAGGQTYLSAATAIVLGVFAAFAATLALSLLLYRMVVLKNTVRYLVELALHALLVLWLVAAALAAVNSLLLLSGVTFRRPFVAIDPVTLLSFAAATIAGQALLLRRIRAYYRGAR